MRLAVVASHPIQYYAPLFRTLAGRLDLTVLFAHRATPGDQAGAGFGLGFEWDVDLLSGYDHRFLRNVAVSPGLQRFAGCDTPEIGECLRRGSFDAVLVLGWRLKSLVQAAFAAKQLGLPLLARGDSQLLTPRSPLKRATKWLAYPPLLRLFDAALYVGKRSRDYWRHYRYPPSRLFFSPHCVDTEWFASRAGPQARAELRQQVGLAPETKVILFAGKLLEIKRPLDVVAAAARLQAAGRDVAVLVAGSGDLLREMTAAAQGVNIALRCLGFCNQSQMPRAYAAADVLALPSDRETWGLVANEALACGRPVVLSDRVGAAPDLVGDNAVGRAFPVGDVAAFAAALDEMLQSQPLPQAIAAKNRAYSLASACDGIQAALAHVAAWQSGRLAAPP